MAKLKTKRKKTSVYKFLNQVKDDKKRKDAKELLKIFKQVTRLQPAMWGNSIIGFGSYHYKSTKSSQEGDWPLTGFSPRSQNLTVYIMPGFEKFKKELKDIGKHKIGASCLYINKLEDIDIKVLKKIIKESVQIMRKSYQTKK